MRLARVFTDHAVLQRDRPIQVCGWADKGATVTVSFAEYVAKATGAEDGAWFVTLPAMQASTAGTILKVASGTTPSRSSPSSREDSLAAPTVVAPSRRLCYGRSARGCGVSILRVDTIGDTVTARARLADPLGPWSEPLSASFASRPPGSFGFDPDFSTDPNFLGADASVVFRSVKAVPEPSTMCLVAFGLLGAFGFRRRRTFA